MSAMLLTGDLMTSSRIAAVASASEWSLSTIGSADELVARAQTDSAALVLVDLSMPHMDIHQTVRRLRELPSPPRAIVAFGPHVHAAKLQQAADAGCDRILTRGQLSRDIEALLRQYLAP